MGLVAANEFAESVRILVGYHSRNELVIFASAQCTCPDNQSRLENLCKIR